MSAIAVVEDEVRELVRRRGLDPAEQPGAVRRLVDEVIADYDERSISGSLAPLPDMLRGPNGLRRGRGFWSVAALSG